MHNFIRIENTEESEWYYIDIEKTQLSNFIRYEFFFRNNEGMLLAYIKFHYIENRNIIYIIDLTNGNGFRHMPDYMQGIYLKKWFKEWIHRPWFCGVALIDVLEYIKSQFPTVKIIPVCSLETSRNNVWRVLLATQEATHNLIDRIWWWWDSSTATLFLQ